jgi:hypothetical protein
VKQIQFKLETYKICDYYITTILLNAVYFSGIHRINMKQPSDQINWSDGDGGGGTGVDVICNLHHLFQQDA